MLAELVERPGQTLPELCMRVKANSGHLAIMLRTLSTVGWVTMLPGSKYKTTKAVAECAASGTVPSVPAIPAAISIDHHWPIVLAMPAVESLASSLRSRKASPLQPPQHLRWQRQRGGAHTQVQRDLHLQSLHG